MVSIGKYFIMAVAASMFMSCDAQKKATSKRMNNNATTSTSFFVSDWNGGNEASGYEVITNNADLNSKLGHGNGGAVMVELTELDPSGKVVAPKTPPVYKYTLPKGQNVVLYNFGMHRSGSYKALGVDSLKLNGKTLVVTLKKPPVDPNKRPGQPEMQIQVLSYPWMAFGVPANYQFDNIEIN